MEKEASASSVQLLDAVAGPAVGNLLQSISYCYAVTNIVLSGGLREADKAVLHLQTCSLHLGYYASDRQPAGCTLCGF